MMLTDENIEADKNYIYVDKIIRILQLSVKLNNDYSSWDEVINLIADLIHTMETKGIVFPNDKPDKINQKLLEIG